MIDRRDIFQKIIRNKFIQLIKASNERFKAANSSQLAAALAYHTIFSLAPLLVISIYVAGLILGQSDVQRYVTNQIQTLVGSEGAELILSMISNLREGNSGLVASLIGLGTVIFGASRIFNQLEISLNIIFESQQDEVNGIENVLRQRGLSFAMMIGVSLLLLLSVLFSTGLSLIKNLFMETIPQWETLINILSYLIPLTMATFLFSVIFKYLPRTNLTLKTTLTGGFITAILFGAGQILISYYLGNSSISSAYGAAGSLLVILVWIYYSALIFYFGAAFTKELTKQNSEKSN